MVYLHLALLHYSVIIEFCLWFAEVSFFLESHDSFSEVHLHVFWLIQHRGIICVSVGIDVIALAILRIRGRKVCKIVQDKTEI